VARQVLERAEMRGRQGKRGASRERGQGCGGEGGAFGGVGSAPDLVEQHQRRGVGLVEYPAQHRDVGAEGREARRYGLPVADVGIEAAEDRQPAPGTDRRNDPALRQRRGEPDGLEQHRLPAGVGPAHEERPLLHREVEVEGNHRLGPG
jgi:hypothetical protein